MIQIKKKHGGAGRGQGRKKQAETYTHQTNVEKQLRTRVITKYGAHFINEKIKELFIYCDTLE